MSNQENKDSSKKTVSYWSPLLATASAADFPIPLFAPVIMKLWPETSTSKSLALKFLLAFTYPCLKNRR